MTWQLTSAWLWFHCKIGYRDNCWRCLPSRFWSFLHVVIYLCHLPIHYNAIHLEIQECLKMVSACTQKNRNDLCSWCAPGRGKIGQPVNLLRRSLNIAQAWPWIELLRTSNQRKISQIIISTYSLSPQIEEYMNIQKLVDIPYLSFQVYHFSG